MTITKEKSDIGYWFWGQFNDATHSAISDIHKQIKKDLQGPHFEPHLTLAGPCQNLKAEDSKALKERLKNFSALELTVSGLQTEEKFFRALYLKILEDEGLSKIRKNLLQVFNLKDSIFNPHVSLYYGTAGKDQRNNIISNLHNWPKKIILDKVSIYSMGLDIDSWSLIESIQLKNVKKS